MNSSPPSRATLLRAAGRHRRRLRAGRQGARRRADARRSIVAHRCALFGSPRDGIVLAHALVQALCHFAQQLVADLVAERVVDLLETIEIEEQHADSRTARARALECGLELVAEEAPVRQPGEAVVVGELPDLVLGLLAFGDVLDHAVHRDRPAPVVAIDLALDLHDPHLPGRPREPALEVHLTVAGKRFAEQHLDARTFILDHARPDEPVRQSVLLLRQPGDREALLGKLDPARGDVPFPAAEPRDALRLR